MNRDKLFFRPMPLYYFDFKKSTAEAHRLLSEVYSDESPSETMCRVCLERFQNSDLDVRDKGRLRHPKKFDNFELLELLDENPAQTLLQ